MKKPMSNRGNGKVNSCQTPAYALDPLLPYLPSHWTIWECAAGEGFLATALENAGLKVLRSDIMLGQDFFSYRPDAAFDAVVTNPPYNPNKMKANWIKRCYEIGKPWANLLPVETIGTGEVQRMFNELGVEIIYLNHRVNFKMPNKGWGGKSQFSAAWFTWGLNIGRPMTFAQIYPKAQDQLSLFEYSQDQLSLFEGVEA
jgi:hypothetical protein